MNARRHKHYLYTDFEDTCRLLATAKQEETELGGFETAKTVET